MQIFPTIRKFFRQDIIEIPSNNFKKIAQLDIQSFQISPNIISTLQQCKKRRHKDQQEQC